LQNPQNEPVLSLVSLWEIQLKLQIGKLHLNQPLDFVVAEQQRVNGLQLLPLAAEHIYGLSQLPFHHKDPFDRLLIAQAIYETLPLMSVDNVFSAYPIKLLW
jgi:PIN domain nuclease of toxin-antitoxin system